MIKHFNLKPSPLSINSIVRRLILGLLILSFSMIGCSQITYHAGKQTDIKILDSVLRLGESTPEEVKTVLGEPVGEGKIMLPIDPKPRDFLSYYYEEGTVKREEGGGVTAESRRMFLFVYFDKGRYDGYMWFSSLPQHAP